MRWDETKKHLVFVIVGINLLPHVFSIPNWVISFALLLFLWRLMCEYRQWPIPEKNFLRGLVVLCAAGIFLQFGTIMGQEPATALLVLMVTAKLFEMKKMRDGVLLIFLCYLLLMAKLIDSQSMEVTLFMIVDVIFITAVLATFHTRSSSGQLRQLIRRSVILAMQSVPLAMALFFVFPRFSLSLWSPQGPAKQMTGFSDSLRPGQVADLAQSDRIAFRVSFPARQPDSISNLYWRGMVLSVSKGLDWDQGLQSNKIKSTAFALTGNEITQDIFFEPSSEVHLFALDQPLLISFPGDPYGQLVKKYDSQYFESKYSLNSRQYYRAYSLPPQYQSESKLLNTKEYLQVLGEVSEPVKKLVEELVLKSHDNVRSKIDLVLNYFVTHKFRYSLKPGLMDSLDDFLFSKRIGFCEHYAGAMATLLRLMGVPSRVVIGFQGGAPSLLKDYYLVRYLDAHAWVEYWDPSHRQWLRTDPVEVVAPQRIQLGATAYKESLQDLNTNKGSLWPQWVKGGISEFLDRVQLIWDQSESLWINFLLRYDWSFQKDLFQKLGMDNKSRWFFLIVVVVLSLVTVLVAMVVIRIAHDKVDPDLALYRQLCAHLEKFGLKKNPDEGPLSYWHRANKHFPIAQNNINFIFSMLIESRYGRNHLNTKKQKELNRKIRYLRLHNS